MNLSTIFLPNIFKSIHSIILTLFSPGSQNLQEITNRNTCQALPYNHEKFESIRGVPYVPPRNITSAHPFNLSHSNFGTMTKRENNRSESPNFVTSLKK